MAQSRRISEQWFRRAQGRLIEGVNSPSRGAAVFQHGPIVIERGRGAKVWDADGNQYIDFMMSFGALMNAAPGRPDSAARKAFVTTSETELAESISALNFVTGRKRFTVSILC